MAQIAGHTQGIDPCNRVGHFDVFSNGEMVEPIVGKVILNCAGNTASLGGEEDFFRIGSAHKMEHDQLNPVLVEN